MDPNKFTGERTGWGEGFECDFGRHVAAPQHAAVLAAGKRVLDAGCGEGFGTHTLCEAARARAVANILGLDPLGVRNRLPRVIGDFAFDKPARLVRRQAGPDGGADIHPEHFAVRADDLDRALDLVAFCRR